MSILYQGAAVSPKSEAVSGVDVGSQRAGIGWRLTIHGVVHDRHDRARSITQFESQQLPAESTRHMPAAYALSHGSGWT